jgi:3-hydroxy-9,10-secoandrosta-1,3,5(10)-triene-9,17-dione monooxygenase reductase component
MTLSDTAAVAHDAADRQLGDDELTADRLRQILSNFPTGVVAITSLAAGTPLGMAIGSFTSVSLDPPLVGFLPAKSSETWPRIEATRRFAVNILCRHQEEICRSLARKAGKFANVSWTVSPGGNPLIDGAAAWIDCELHSVADVGDHMFVVGNVRRLAASEGTDPLIFFRRTYGGFTRADT